MLSSVSPAAAVVLPPWEVIGPTPATASPLATPLAGQIDALLSPVLVAHSEEEAGWALEALLEDPAYWSLCELGAEQVSFATLTDLAAPTRHAQDWRRLLGEEAAVLVLEGSRLHFEVTTALARLGPATTEVDPSEPPNPLAFAYDPATPVEVKQILFDALRAGVASAALGAARHQGEPLSTARALWLAQTFHSGLHGLLRLLASHPSAPVPVTVIAEQERLDLAALHERAGQIEAWMLAGAPTP